MIIWLWVPPELTSKVRLNLKFNPSLDLKFNLIHASMWNCLNMSSTYIRGSPCINIQCYFVCSSWDISTEKTQEFGETQSPCTISWRLMLLTSCPRCLFVWLHVDHLHSDLPPAKTRTRSNSHSRRSFMDGLRCLTEGSSCSSMFCAASIYQSQGAPKSQAHRIILDTQGPWITEGNWIHAGIWPGE